MYCEHDLNILFGRTGNGPRPSVFERKDLSTELNSQA